MNADVRAAEQRLVALFRDGEWPTERVWLRRRQDRNPFISANIVLILEQCRTIEPALTALMTAARAQLGSYREAHRAFHWPVRHGVSAMSDAPPLWRHRWVEISPDADCTCLVQLARRDAGMDDAIAADLAFYRADGERFRLPGLQRPLPAAAGTFLTWFPPRELCRSGKLETVDAGTDANILWYLAATGRLDTPGAAETTAFLVEVVRQALALRQPFRVSMYYPKPAVLLYLISRAAVWGGISTLLVLREQVLAQLTACPASSTLEILCREAAARLWGAPASARPLPIPDGRDAFYIGPLLAWPLQRFGPLERLARWRRTHIAFRSESLEWALYLWLHQVPLRP